MEPNKDKKYLEEILDKFNKNPDDETLSNLERVLLNKVKISQQEYSKLMEQIKNINEEIKERNDMCELLKQEAYHKQGKTQGFIDSLLSLRE